MEYTKRFHEFYENAKELVDRDILNISEKLDEIPDSEEKEFYFAVMTHFLQKRQKDVINRGLF
jgi:hypothetical protein